MGFIAMGFKRTNEGRIYFKGDEENARENAKDNTGENTGGKAAPRPIDYRTLTKGAQKTAPSQSPSPAAAGQGINLQILTLLRTLNDKLKDSQGERAKMQSELDAYRKVIEELADKARRAEKSQKEFEQKLSGGTNGQAERAEKLSQEAIRELQETRKLFLELEEKTEKSDQNMMTIQRQLGQTRAVSEEIIRKTAGFDSVAKRLDEAEKIQQDLTRKIDDAASQQAKMLRQIEKVAEDRARFMRKIERIEETVIQTRDALSAKAMVLLTEQGAKNAMDLSESPGPMTAGPRTIPEQLKSSAAIPDITNDNSGWKNPLLQVAGVGVLIALGLMAGWAYTAFQQNNQAIVLEPATTQQSDLKTEIAPTDSAQITEQNSPDKTTPEPQVNSEPVTAQPGAAQANDIGSIDINDSNALEKMLGENPDAVAAMLNAIEPGSMPPPLPPEALKSDAIQETKKIVSADTRTKKSPIKNSETVDTGKPIAAKDLKKSMRPDATLPAAAQSIESKAYDGTPEAQHDLAAIYTAGQGGVRQDYERAAFWFGQAANRGIPNAQYNLGVLYHQGLGVKTDINKAIDLYKQAASAGHPEAQYNLGIAYIEGIGVPYDARKAADNFESAAGKGVAEAAYNLGLIYENGLLGKAQPDVALKWYKSAADAGNPEAKEALAELAKNLNIKPEELNRVTGGNQ